MMQTLGVSKDDVAKSVGHAVINSMVDGGQKEQVKKKKKKTGFAMFF
jgi:hypothetical protein